MRRRSASAGGTGRKAFVEEIARNLTTTPLLGPTYLYLLSSHILPSFLPPISLHVHIRVPPSYTHTTMPHRREDESSGDVAIDILDSETDAPSISNTNAKHHSVLLHSSTKRSIPLVELSLENITYAPITRSASRFNKSKNERRSILSDVSTKISPYQLTAWMGPSGSGKTSLVSVAAGLLADPTKDLIDNSCIRINNEKGTLPKRLVGVVWQEDLLLPNLTVHETVRFAARLKTPKEQTDGEVEVLVEETLSQLGLTHVQHSLIGGGAGKRGISGGERKRVAVAVELVARPSVLLLDEPTSGLDSSTAFKLMLTLKELASLGHAIAVVIHQPRTSIFNLFDNLLLLQKGNVVYEGKASEVKRYLEACPLCTKLPPETGLADWLMDMIDEDEKRDGGGKLPALWKNHSSKQPQANDATNSADQQLQSTGFNTTPRRMLDKRLSSLAELKSEPKFQTGFVTQLRLLAKRASKQQRGERITRVATLLTACWIAFTALAWGRIPDTSIYVFNRASLLFFMIIAQSNGVVVSSMMAFSSERRLLSRERAKKLYGVLPYFIAKTLSDMVNSVALPLLYGCVVYWLCNFRATAVAFFTFALTYYLTIAAAQSTGLFLSIAIPNFAVALLLAPLLTVCLMILGGFYIPFESIHPALFWASYLSNARYGFSAFIVNEFDGREVPCDGGLTEVDECPLSGSSIVASFGIDGVWGNIWVNIGMLVLIQFVLRSATYFLLLRSK